MANRSSLFVLFPSTNEMLWLCWTSGCPWEVISATSQPARKREEQLEYKSSTFCLAQSSAQHSTNVTTNLQLMQLSLSHLHCISSNILAPILVLCVVRHIVGALLSCTKDQQKPGRNSMPVLSLPVKWPIIQTVKCTYIQLYNACTLCL